MRFALIIGQTHTGNLEIVAGPGDPMDMNQEFKDLAADPKNAKYAELQLHELQSGSGRKRASFPSPAAVKPSRTSKTATAKKAANKKKAVVKKKAPAKKSAAKKKSKTTPPSASTLDPDLPL